MATSNIHTSSKGKRQTSSILVECEDCEGSGLSSSRFDPRGRAVECANCAGSGAEELKGVVFRKRRHKRGVTVVYPNRASADPSRAVSLQGITYAQWRRHGFNAAVNPVVKK